MRATFLFSFFPLDSNIEERNGRVMILDPSAVSSPSSRLEDKVASCSIDLFKGIVPEHAQSHQSQSMRCLKAGLCLVVFELSSNQSCRAFGAR